MPKNNDLYVIEDAAHAISIKYKDKKIGSIGDATCFSFYATKNITTAEGGMVTTNHKDLPIKLEYSVYMESVRMLGKDTHQKDHGIMKSCIQDINTI